MKKYVLLMLIIVFCFSFCGCNNENNISDFEVNENLPYVEGGLSEKVYKEMLKEQETIKNYEYRLSTTVGVANIGNGQMLEYSYGSDNVFVSADIAAFEYKYMKETTSINRESIINTYQGTYMPIHGNVTDVTSAVIYTEVQYTPSDSSIPKYYTIPITIVSEQQNLLYDINVGDNVLLYGKIDLLYEDVWDSSHRCYDGIIREINDKKYEVPILNSVNEGIYKIY
ncbi:MAG: hypothetical protein IKW59_04165 [Clostridia bacterium]|nr:hypothetical protein [Clostridia bacterium]